MHTAPRHPDPRFVARRAFSLVELVMVLAIISVLVGIAVPRYSNSLDRVQVDAVARRLVVDLQYAQRSAKASNQPQTVELNWPAWYELVGLKLLGRSSKPYRITFNEAPNNVTAVAYDFGGDAELIFDIYGMPDTAGWIKIQAGNHSRTVTIDANTGRAEITE